MDRVLSLFLVIVGILGGVIGLFTVWMATFIHEEREEVTSQTTKDMRHTKRFYRSFGWIFAGICGVCLVVGILGFLFQ